MEGDVFMPKKSKKKAETQFSNLFVAHSVEQVEASASSFTSMMSHYGMQGCVYIEAPNGEMSVFAFTNEETPESYRQILSNCSKMTKLGKNINIDNQP
jgi:hypothetical protein